MNRQRNSQIYNTVKPLLVDAGVPVQWVEQLLSPSGISLLDNKLRYVKYDPVNNFELDEFIGDTIINFAVARFVLSNYSIPNVGIANNLKLDIQSNRVLGELAEQLGLSKLVLGADLVPENKRWKFPGDVLEGFVGALYNMVRQTRTESAAILVCSMVVDSFLVKLPRYNVEADTKPLVTQYKERYVAEWEKAGIAESTLDVLANRKSYQQNDDGTVTTAFRGYVPVKRDGRLIQFKGVPVRVSATPVVVGQGQGKDINAARRLAAANAITYLDNLYEPVLHPSATVQPAPSTETAPPMRILQRDKGKERLQVGTTNTTRGEVRQENVVRATNTRPVSTTRTISSQQQQARPVAREEVRRPRAQRAIVSQTAWE